MNEHYKMGWNDRVAKRGEDYGKVYRTRGGGFAGPASWTDEESEEYVHGWDDANAKIASLAIPEAEGMKP